MGATAGLIGTTGAIPLTISLACIVLPGVLRGLRATSARDTRPSFFSRNRSPPLIEYHSQSRLYRFRAFKIREMSRCASRFLIASRLSKTCLPCARASSTFTSAFLK